MNVDALSDSELRTKLSEYGYPVGPVTQTTRKILVKKLKTLMESRTGGSRHSMAARYSSDETDDDNSANSKKKKKAPVNTRRQTLANPMPPPSSLPLASPSVSKSPSKKRISKVSNEDSETSEFNSVPSVTSRITSKSEKTFVKSNSKLSKDNDGLETGSDSDAVDEPPPKPTGVTKFGGGSTKLYSNRTPTSKPPVIDVNSPANWRKSVRDPIDSSSGTSGFGSTTSREDRYSINLPSITRHLDSSKGDSLSSLRESTKKDDPLANYETPYLSEFTRKLSIQASINLPSQSKSNLKGSKLRYSGLNAPEVKETDSNGHYNSTLRSSYPSSSSMTYVTSSLDKTNRDIGKAYKSTSAPREEVKDNQNFISMGLVIGLAIFFGVLAFVYLGLEGKTEFPLLPADSDIPICSTSEQEKYGVQCIAEENVKDTLQLIKRLHPILMKRAIASECENTKEPPYLSGNEIIALFSTSKSAEVIVKQNLHMAHLLIFKNPKWGISLIEILGEKDELQVLDSMDKVFLTRLDGKLGLMISEPDLPLQCLMRKKIMTVISSLLIAAMVALTAIGGHKLVQWYLRRKKDTEKEIFKLVSEIINMLEHHHQNFATSSPGGTQESYLAINHIRDQLIPPKDRRKLATSWEKAVKFLDENESRIRREVQLVSGEEFQVWRWLPSSSTTPNSPGASPIPKMSKVWQGSAFETMEGSVNSPACSPTPCLKIRHMFDPDVEFEENWETKVKDAILEKCGEGVKILHIKVDRGSREGCVYMKCMSQEDAGKAYKALHGCWFDGHLVTVKYLRLERYHERFPEAVNYKTPLKPSNNKRLSMQAHYWTNSAEAN